jgi:amino acid transporter
MAGWTLVATRYVFAFSFDRVFPVTLADISDRFRFPLKAAIANLIVACVFFALAAFTPFLGLWLNSIAITSLVWLVASVAAIVLPFKMKAIADVLPGKGWKVPLISILGFISMVCMIANFYWDATTPAIGPSTFQADLMLMGILIVGIAVFTVSYMARKREGIDLRLVYTQLPPE